MFQYKCPVCGRFGLAERKICPSCRLALRDADVYETGKTPGAACGAMIGWTWLGGIFSLVSLFLGLGFAAGGHGWLIPGVAALTTFITGPGTGLAWALRRSRNGWGLAFGLMFFEVLADFWLVLIHFHNSDERFQRAWEDAPAWLIVWAVLFLGHQLVSCMIVFWYKRSS